MEKEEDVRIRRITYFVCLFYHNARTWNFWQEYVNFTFKMTSHTHIISISFTKINSRIFSYTWTITLLNHFRPEVFFFSVPTFTFPYLSYVLGRFSKAENPEGDFLTDDGKFWGRKRRPKLVWYFLSRCEIL